MTDLSQEITELLLKPSMEEIESRFLLLAARDEIELLRVALADAICRPEGVVPVVAERLVSKTEIDLAKTRKPLRRYDTL